MKSSERSTRKPDKSQALSRISTPTPQELQALYDGSPARFMPEVFQSPKLETMIQEASKSETPPKVNRPTHKLPDPPVIPRDLPDRIPRISQREIVAAATAYDIYRLAKADFEAKRAGLKLKLLMLCKPKDGWYDAELTEGGEVVIIDSSSEGEPERTKLV